MTLLTLYCSLNQPILLPASNFQPFNHYHHALSKQFETVSFKRYVYYKPFDSVFSLLHWMKSLGIQGHSAFHSTTNIRWTPGFLNRLEQLFLQKFGAVKVRCELCYFVCGMD